jgi:hypothetical protein
LRRRSFLYYLRPSPARQRVRGPARVRVLLRSRNSTVALQPELETRGPLAYLCRCRVSCRSSGGPVTSSLAACAPAGQSSRGQYCQDAECARAERSGGLTRRPLAPVECGPGGRVWSGASQAEVFCKSGWWQKPVHV